MKNINSEFTKNINTHFIIDKYEYEYVNFLLGSIHRRTIYNGVDHEVSFKLMTYISIVGVTLQYNYDIS